mgnify:CR=1 FL=1
MSHIACEFHRRGGTIPWTYPNLFIHGSEEEDDEIY